MAAVLTLQLRRPAGPGPAALGALLGAAFTLALFLGLAQLEKTAPALVDTEFVDVRPVALPAEPPPPPPAPETPRATAPPDAALAGLEPKGDPASAVKLAVPPRELGQLLPPPAVAPPARIQGTILARDFRPRPDYSVEMEQRVYQQSEVDQRPRVLVTSNPFVPGNVRRGAAALRVILLLVVDTMGQGKDVRIFRSSGNAEFDAIIVRCVQEDWNFSPAIKKGRPVRCLVQQVFTVRWTSTPFDN